MRGLASLRAALIAGGMAAVLGGCTQTVITLPPVTSYAPADCAETPDLAGALSLTPDKDKAVWETAADITSESPCVILEGSATPYLVYALPPAERAKLIEIGSVVETIRLFSPTVSLLDADGAVTRTLNPDGYMYRNGMLSVQFVPAEGEQFVMVSANPAAVGERREGLVAGVNVNTIYTGFGASNWYSGAESQFSQGFSYEGTVRALVYRPDND